MEPHTGLQGTGCQKEVGKVNPSQPRPRSTSIYSERQVNRKRAADTVVCFATLDVHPDGYDRYTATVLFVGDSAHMRVGRWRYSWPKKKYRKTLQMITTADEFGLDSSMVACRAARITNSFSPCHLSEYDKIKGNPNLTPIGTYYGRGNASPDGTQGRFRSRAQGYGVEQFLSRSRRRSGE